MRTSISFDNVSKRYRLGAAQASLRVALGRLLARRPDGTSKASESIWALKEVSFNLQKGKALGLIGPNGSGKTTILKLLSSITQPSSGKIEVKGRVSALIELGAGFHPDLSGLENIYLNGAILGLKRSELDRLVPKIVEFSGLERFVDTPIKRYSSGMYVRLGFSVAAHVQPDVLLVDEVLAVGDAHFRQRCAKRIEELRQAGTTIVFVAHNLFLVRSICDSAMFLLNGQVQAQGDVVEVIGQYEKWLHQKQAREARLNPSENLTSFSSVEIAGVEVLDQQELPREQFSHNEVAQIRVHFVAREPIHDPNLVLRISRADGVTCCMLRSRDYRGQLEPLEGEGCISVVIEPLQLAGGAFVVEARLTGSIDGVVLAQAHSSWFQVSGLSVGHEASCGVFVPKMTDIRVLGESDGAVVLTRSALNG